MSQTEQILSHLKSGRPIDPMEALDKFGCFRLAARVNEIRDAGWEVSTIMKKRGDKRWAEYRLEQ